MARIRKVEIRNFRAVRTLDWCPSEGVNCLIGPGDSGKSTILDAIDFCLGARRNLAIADPDFHALDVTPPISIAVTLGGLPDSMLNIESFGEYLRGFDAATGNVEDEPRKGLEYTFREAVVRARERNRHLGRPVARRAVGSTLLLKGLEADVAVVLNPAAMDAQHLYVALTRGAKRLVVCSATPMLVPM